MTEEEKLRRRTDDRETNTERMIFISVIVAALMIVGALLARQADAACEWSWVDDDYDTSTDPIYVETCDRQWDTRTIEPIAPIQPIQSPRLRSIDQSNLVIPPAGTASCDQQLTYDSRRRQWIEQIICQ